MTQLSLVSQTLDRSPSGAGRVGRASKHQTNMCKGWELTTGRKVDPAGSSHRKGWDMKSRVDTEGIRSLDCV